MAEKKKYRYQVRTTLAPQWEGKLFSICKTRNISVATFLRDAVKEKIRKVEIEEWR